MELEEIIEKVRKENQQKIDNSENVAWNNCVDFICDKLKLELGKNV